MDGPGPLLIQALFCYTACALATSRNFPAERSRGLSRWGWALLLMAVVVAAGLRLYRLGVWPPGPYRDEAYNGLDALNVLRGQLALFFPANNGREPVYIYLVSAAVALLGPTVQALRLPAAIIGTLATVPVYWLGRDWFGRTTGLLAAFLWATTFWPVHLGRVGLRVGLLAPALALAFWLGTRAYRERRAGLWFWAGVVYGLSFYTYLAARFTPLLLGLFVVYLIVTGRRERLWDGGRALCFVLGAGLAIAPLAVVLVANPSFLFGRAGQVSILSPAMNGGDPLGALLGNAGRALGMFLYRGDAILRHNALLRYDVVLKAAGPAGRPVFDWLMAGPFLIGLVVCLQHWRRPAAALTLLWTLVMLGPTILAEDAPHFLRAAGVLPVALFFPAVGLAALWDWRRLPVAARRALVILLLAGSAALTIRNYAVYARQPDVGFLFESAAAELARSASADLDAGTAVYLDRRFADGWPSVRFLLNDRPVTFFDARQGLPGSLAAPSAIYTWPYDSLDYLIAATGSPAVVNITPGPLARGDLEPEPYSLYTRYAIRPGPDAAAPLAVFDGAFRLRNATATPVASDEFAVALRWEAEPVPAGGRLPKLFIHAVGPEGLLAQIDGPVGRGLWPVAGWQPGVVVGERYTLRLPRPFDPASDQLQIGLYWADTNERLPAFDARGDVAGDYLIVRPEP